MTLILSGIESLHQTRHETVHRRRRAEAEVARRLGVDRSTLYRALARAVQSAVTT